MQIQQHLRHPLRSNWFVFAATLIVNGGLTRLRPLQQVDTSIYTALADQMLEGTLSELFTPAVIHWTKLTYLSILAAARWVSSEHWMQIMLGVNILCAALTGTMLAWIVRHSTRSEAAVFVALLFYLSGFDILHWVRCMLTDTIYAAAALAVFAVLVRDLYGVTGKRNHLLLVLALAGAVLSRPPGILLIPLVVFAVLFLVRLPEKRSQIRLAVVLLLVVALGAPIVRAAIVQDPNIWPFRFLRPRLDKLAARANSGVVINDRPEVARPAPRGLTDHLVVQGDRFVRFFQFTSARFSRGHNLANIVWFGPLYLLGLAGTIAGMRSVDWRRRSLVLACLLWIFGYAWLFALTELDFDWRYRMPLLPQFIVLAACGVDAWLTPRSGASAPQVTLAIEH